MVTSIHQPRSSIFTLFDDIVLLSAGRLVYHGPSGDDALAYFAGQGYVCPSYFNPADFFLDLVSVDTRSLAAERKSRARIDFLVSEYRRAFAERSLRKYTYNSFSADVVAETRRLQQRQSARSSKV